MEKEFDSYHFRVNIPVDAAIAKLRAAVAAFPMGLVAHIDGQANCARMGIEVPADQILEIFRPDFAIRVWKADKHAGLDIPIRIYVYELDGKTHVVCRLPSRVFAPYANVELDSIGRELDAIFMQLLAVLETDKERPIQGRPQ